MSDPVKETKKRFRVKVGLSEVVVRCATRQDAVRMARKELCQEVPRMWDVIQQLSDKQFLVHPMHH